MYRTEDVLEIMAPLCARQVELCESALQPSVSCRPDDHTTFTSTMFAAKQLEHMRSIACLIHGECHTDSTVIARVMLEGAAKITWLMAEAEERCRDWCAFAVVHDYQLLHKLRSEGVVVPATDEEQLLDRLLETGGVFLKRGERDPTDPNSYHNKWPKHQLSALIEEYEAKLRPLYKELSSWMHWGLGSLGQRVRREGNRLLFDFDRQRDGAGAVVSAFQSCGVTFQLFTEHCNLPERGSFQDLLDDCSRALRSISVVDSHPRSDSATADRTTSNTRRVPSDALGKSILAHVRSAPGQRLEEIGRALGEPTKGLKRPIANLLAAGLLRTEGQKRGTRYFVGRGAKRKA